MMNWVYRRNAPPDPLKATVRERWARVDVLKLILGSLTVAVTVGITLGAVVRLYVWACRPEVPERETCQDSSRLLTWGSSYQCDHGAHATTQVLTTGAVLVVCNCGAVPAADGGMP